MITPINVFNKLSPEAKREVLLLEREIKKREQYIKEIEHIENNLEEPIL